MAAQTIYVLKEKGPEKWENVKKNLYLLSTILVNLNQTVKFYYKESQASYSPIPKLAVLKAD